MRPRLAPHVRARRHLIGGQSAVLLHHGGGGPPLGIGEREWRVLRAMDGTRDLEGVAAASAVGVAHVAAFARRLAGLGLLGDAAAADEVLARPARDLPVRALPGYAFRCHGIGACCAMADTILFTPLEAARARGAAPEVLEGGHDEARVFCPDRGLDASLLAAAMVDGACAYLDGAGRCRVHPVRPHGCRTFPRWHVDVGHEIRVATRMACACELEPGGDEPLAEVSRGGELPAALWVDRLPSRARLGATEVSAAEALAFTDAIDWSGDAFATAEASADALGAPALDRAGLRERVAATRAAHAWRAPGDRLRRSLEWMAQAVDREASEPLAEDERLVARAFAFVGGLVLEGDVGRALRGLSERLFLARRMPEASRAEGFARHPIALVNAVARATALW